MQMRLPMGSLSEKNRRATVALTMATLALGLWSLLIHAGEGATLKKGNSHCTKIADRDLSKTHNRDRFPCRGGTSFDIQPTPVPAVGISNSCSGLYCSYAPM